MACRDVRARPTSAPGPPHLRRHFHVCTGTDVHIQDRRSLRGGASVCVCVRACVWVGVCEGECVCGWVGVCAGVCGRVSASPGAALGNPRTTSVRTAPAEQPHTCTQLECGGGGPGPHPTQMWRGWAQSLSDADVDRVGQVPTPRRCGRGEPSPQPTQMAAGVNRR